MFTEYPESSRRGAGVLSDGDQEADTGVASKDSSSSAEVKTRMYMTVMCPWGEPIYVPYDQISHNGF